MVHYEGIFFDKKTQDLIISLDKNKLPILNDEIHCTFKSKPTTDELFDEIIGHEIEIELVGYGSDGKNSGFEIKIPDEYKKYYINYEEEDPSKLKKIHITTSISEDSKAYLTKNLNFIPLEKPIKVTGKFGYWIKEEDETEYLTYEKQQDNLPKYIKINRDNLVKDDIWQTFRKVRAIIENNNTFAITEEGGKLIFPGGKCDKDEDFHDAIGRELREETGITFQKEDLNFILKLETFYSDFFDYRSQSLKPRHTITYYYYVKTSDNINKNNQSLTVEEIKENFKIDFISREELIKQLSIDHSNVQNGRFFDEENQIILENFIK